MIGEIVARLTAGTAGALSSVQVAEDLDAVLKGTAPKQAAAFVIPHKEQASDNALVSGGFRQRVEVFVIVAFVIRHHADAKGAERATRFDAAKSAIEAALAGWEPGSAVEPMQLVAGEADPAGNGVTLFAQVWKTARFLTGA